jgi:hypothetical protein
LNSRSSSCSGTGTRWRRQAEQQPCSPRGLSRRRARNCWSSLRPPRRWRTA